MSRWNRDLAARSIGIHQLKYTSALAAIGLGLLVRFAGAQAVTPIDISGQQPALPPAMEPTPAPPPPAAVTPPTPIAAPAPAAPVRAAPQVAQAVTPIDIATQPAASLPAVPSPPATLAAPTPAPPTPTPATPPTPVAQVPDTTPAATGPSTGPVAIAPEVDLGKSYKVTGIKVAYKNQNSQQPPIEDLLNTEITLGIAGNGYVSAGTPGSAPVTLKLSEIGQPGPSPGAGADQINRPTQIYRSGIAAIYGHIVRYFNAKSIIGVFVVIDAADIDTSDNDIRPPDRSTLQFVVVTSVVKQVRTVSIGENTSEADRVDNPRHASILEHSPLKAAPPPPATTEASTSPAPVGEQDLLRKDVLDDYVLRLNRQPGRRVDVAVSGTGDPGGVTLDYLVSENRPWYIYGQASNTGTKQTNEWRERFGFVDNQLTGHDDILSLDYLTAGFSASNAIILSYEAPFLNFDRMRYKMYGSWNEFTASDVGQNNENFTGSQWTAGDELIWNIFQHRELFVDAVFGERYSGIETTNVTAQTEGRANYYEPYLGLRMERNTDIATTSGYLTVVGYITDDSQKSIDGLGRADTTRNPVLLQFDIAQSVFLEPILAPGAFAAGTSSLAHELYFSARGQWAFNDRLFPQIEDVAGGLYSVRGYPESITAGDSVFTATAEYRFHLPRIFGIQTDPSKTPFLWEKNFRFSPSQAYGHPDWDLIFRAFVDAGQVINSHRETFEKNATLVGTGVGVEFQFKQNLNIRVDWGTALTDIPDEVKAGSNRFHISSTILY